MAPGRRRAAHRAAARRGGWGWWPANGVEYAAFVLNIALLFCLGLVTARWSARSWAAAVAIGAVDALLGVVVVVANALIK